MTGRRSRRSAVRVVVPARSRRHPSRTGAHRRPDREEPLHVPAQTAPALRRRRRHPGPDPGLGGTAYAATKLPAHSVGTAQLKNLAVTDTKLHGGAVTRRTLANNAVNAAAVAPDSLSL